MPITHPSSVSSSSPDAAQREWLRIVQENVNGLRFGVVQIVVHDSQVVQIDRTEKTRLDHRAGKGGDHA